MNLLAKFDAIDTDASRYNFVLTQCRIFVAFNYCGRIITAPARMILGGIAHGRFVYTKDPRKRVKIEPPDKSLIAGSNGRVESMPRNRNVLYTPGHERRVVDWYPLRNEAKRTPTKEFFDVPLFDRGSFLNSAIDELAEKAGKTDFEIREWFKWLVGHAQYKGDTLLATWQFGRVSNASPTVTRPAPTREQLERIAFRRSNAKHVPWVNRDAAEVEANARRYRKRLNNAARGYDDLLRWSGKATTGFDITYTQAAHRERQELLFGREPNNRDPNSCDGYFDKCRGALPGYPGAFVRRDWHWRVAWLRSKSGAFVCRAYQARFPLIKMGEDWRGAYQDHRLSVLLWVLALQPPWFILSVLRKPAALFSLFGTTPYLVPTEGKRFSIPPRYYACVVGIRDEITGYTIGNRFLTERGEHVLSKEALTRNKNLKPARPAYEFPEVEMLSRKDELEYFRRWEWDGDPEAANAIYEAHRPLFINIAKQYATGDLTVEDLLVDGYTGEKNEKTGRYRTGLFCCLENYDPFRGRISTFLAEPFEWACADSRRRYKIRKRQEHASLNAPIGDDEDGDTWQDMAVAEVSDGEEYDEQQDTRLAALKAHLTEEEYRILMLRHVDSKSRREVAEACGITQDKVRWIETKATAFANPKNGGAAAISY